MHKASIVFGGVFFVFFYPRHHSLKKKENQALTPNHCIPVLDNDSVCISEDKVFGLFHFLLTALLSEM